MKTLSTHITESFIHESALDDSLKTLLVAQRLPTSGSKIKAVKAASDKIVAEIEKISTEELIKLHSSASNGSALAMYLSKELTFRAYELLQDDANKKHKGDIGDVQTIKHAIEILQAK